MINPMLKTCSSVMLSPATYALLGAEKSEAASRGFKTTRRELADKAIKAFYGKPPAEAPQSDSAAHSGPGGTE
jgi:hypothetical protein